MWFSSTCGPEGGAYCEGPVGEDECEESDECAVEDCGPALGMPSYLCEDGVTWGGPTGECAATETGGCGWVIIECPE